MTFLNPLLLVGLAAAAIPIILHLLNLRQLRTIEFSTLRFLKELQRSTIRRVKIRQWILLLLRTLIIASLVLAFSRPIVRGSFLGTAEASARTTLVLLLDNSASTSRRDEGGEVFSQLKRTAVQIIETLKDEDEIFFVPTSHVREADGYTAYRNGDEIISTIDQSSISPRRSPYRDAFGVAARLLVNSVNLNQEVILLTDGQASQFLLEGTDTTKLFNDRVRLIVLTAGKSEENASVTSLAVGTRILSELKPVRLENTVFNFGSSPLRGGLLSVYVEGNRVVQRSIELNPESGTTIESSFLTKRSGLLRGYVEIEEDKFELDNRRYFALKVPKRVSVLVVGAKPDINLLTLALSAGKDSSSEGLFEIESIEEDRLSAAEFSRYNTIILCGVRDFSQTEADRLEQFARSGGGLVIFPGDRLDIRNYNETIFRSLNIPPILSLPVSPDGPGGSFITFDQVDLKHPLFEGMFENPLSGTSSGRHIESPRVFRKIDLTVSTKGNSIIRMGDGSEFLAEYQLDSGRILVFAVAPSLSWSDFPVKGIFVPILYRGALYTGTLESGSASTISGEQIEFVVRSALQEEGATHILRAPSGQEEKIIPRLSMASGIATFTSRTTDEIGIYELVRRSQSDQVLDLGAVNLDPEESDLDQITEEEFFTFLSRLGMERYRVSQLLSGEDLKERLSEARMGVELWKHFVLLALLCALAEMIVGRAPRSSNKED